MNNRVRLNNSLWVRSPNIGNQQVFQPIFRALQGRDARVFLLKSHADAESLARLKQIAWQTEDHIILHGLMPRELNAILSIFKDRKNFSMALVDWWTSPFWFNQHADHLFFHNYNGIAVRTKLCRFLEGASPPLWSGPERMIWYALACTALRAPALAAWPVLEVWKRLQRRFDEIKPERLLYFPFPIDEADVPLQLEAPQYDFTNLGATTGFWVLRDAYAPASLNFTNLYCDRKRLTSLMLRFENRPFKIFDRRRKYEFYSWAEVCRIIRQSRFAVCSGGLHRASIPKFLEYVCLGTPIIGAGLPYEYPWLDKCLFPVDMMRIRPAELKLKMQEALEVHPKLKENCLAIRDTLLRAYNADHLLDMLQDQLDGKKIPPGYLKV